ncbi:MAG: hypothetical protein ABFC24_06685 [Methanoregulaceae archaeon]
MAEPESSPVDPVEKRLRTAGIIPGKKMDVRALEAISNSEKIEVILFFEEPLAREADYGAVRERFSHVPEYERPFVRVQSFLRFAAESDPSFHTRLAEFPLKIEIVGFGEYQDAGKTRNIVKGLMPFLGEIDFDSDKLPGQE